MRPRAAINRLASLLCIANRQNQRGVRAFYQWEVSLFYSVSLTVRISAGREFLLPLPVLRERSGFQARERALSRGLDRDLSRSTGRGDFGCGRRPRYGVGFRVHHRGETTTEAFFSRNDRSQRSKNLHYIDTPLVRMGLEPIG